MTFLLGFITFPLVVALVWYLHPALVYEALAVGLRMAAEQQRRLAKRSETR